MKLNLEVIIGCMSWAKWGKEYSTSEIIELLHFCSDNDLSTFDHADIYGDYTTEGRFGEAFAKSGIQREKVQLITKCGIQYVGQTRDNSIKHYNYSKEYIIWSAEESLRNLKTDYLDLFLLHRPSPLMEPNEILEAIQKLKLDGKILNFGVSNFTPSQVDLIQSKVDVQVNQIEFSLTQHLAMFDGSLDHMIVNGIKPMAWSPLGSYFKDSNAQTLRIKKMLQKLSEKYGVEEDVVLLAWIFKHPAKIAPVIGTTNKDRMLHAKKASQLSLELEDWFSLLVASQGHKVP